MKDERSITHCIHKIKEGESAAANALWEHYFEKLVRLARRKLDGMPRRMADEEDVARVFGSESRDDRYFNMGTPLDMETPVRRLPKNGALSGKPMS